ncbi:hypothetical protein [Xanthomarina spongicola]|uniref:Fimbrial assembly protein PilN n=1 Tax=Xanthomarina spongicola TaxID=570520 RepID=A0A316DHI3_9FLAO|nr:hypothetical protein [Xanthomarina spongicola]PWK17108.1 hypothetical protein LX78_02847 [Xanthomarina spongicola]
MLEKLKQYLLFGNTFYGVEHTIIENKETIIVVSLKKKKNDLDIVLKKTTDSIESVSSYIPKKSGVTIVINNDKVLSKKVPFSKDEDSKLIQNAFPNINLNEFYFDVLCQKNACFIAICRKQYVDTLIEDYRNKNLFVLNVSFGNHVFSNISEFLDSEEVFTSNALIEKNRLGIENINKQSNTITQEYDINGLNVSNMFLLSFAAILELVLSKKVNEQSNFDSKYAALTNDYQQQRFFSQFLKVGLLFVLTILFINFFIFNHYFNKVSDLRQTSQVNETSRQQLIAIKEDVDKKEKFITDILKSESSRSSFYANAIMISLPQSINISEFNFQPLTKRVKAEKPIEYELNTILLKGISSVTSDISNWVTELERLNWVEKVIITEYSESNMSLTEFSLLITIK